MATAPPAPSMPGKPAECGPRARVVLQQCLSARLMVQPATDSDPAQFVQIERGVIAFVCFLKGADEELVEKMAKSVLGIRLSSSDSGRLVSVCDLPGDLLIVPQATLGGRPKGKQMQYHTNIDKAVGHQLYNKLCELCTAGYQETPACQEYGKTVKCGTYGNTQVLSTDTNGPYTHLLEF